MKSTATFGGDLRPRPRTKESPDGVAMVPLSLRDEMVWRDGSAAADGLKPTATFGGRSVTKDKNRIVAHLLLRSPRRKKLLRLPKHCRLLRPASHQPGDFDRSAPFNIHHEPVSLKHSHAQQRSRLGDIHRDASRPTIPDHSSVVDVKENIVAIRQQRGTASPPRQRQPFNKLRRKRQPAIKSGIDDRVDFHFVAGRTLDSHLNDGLAIRSDLPLNHVRTVRCAAPKCRECRDPTFRIQV